MSRSRRVQTEPLHGCRLDLYVKRLCNGINIGACVFRVFLCHLAALMSEHRSPRARAYVLTGPMHLNPIRGRVTTVYRFESESFLRALSVHRCQLAEDSMSQ
jgi:hypothetical protein